MFDFLWPGDGFEGSDWLVGHGVQREGGSRTAPTSFVTLSVSAGSAQARAKNLEFGNGTRDSSAALGMTLRAQQRAIPNEH